MEIRMKIRNRITIICFLILIFGLSVCSLLKGDKDFSDNENRVLSQKPDFDIKAVLNGAYEEDYEEYLSDQFILRDQWIGLKTYTEMAMMKKEINGIYFGKDNYLIPAHTTEEYYTEQALDNYGDVKEFVERYQDIMDIKLLLVPSSQEILKEKLPAYVDTAGETQVISHIYSDIDKKNVVNVVDTLKNHSEEYIYYRTDHHWTTLGAYYAYVEYLNSIGISAQQQGDYQIEKAADDFYGTSAAKVNIRTMADTICLYRMSLTEPVWIRYNESEDIRDSMYDESALETRDKYSVFLGGNNALLEMRLNETNGNRLLIIKDSYAHSFIPFLANHFDEIDVVDLRYYRQSIEQLIRERDYTHVLILYSLSNLAADTSLYKLNLSSQ